MSWKSVDRRGKEGADLQRGLGQGQFCLQGPRETLVQPVGRRQGQSRSGRGREDMRTRGRRRPVTTRVPVDLRCRVRVHHQHLVLQFVLVRPQHLDPDIRHSGPQQTCSEGQEVDTDLRDGRVLLHRRLQLGHLSTSLQRRQTEVRGVPSPGRQRLPADSHLLDLSLLLAHHGVKRVNLHLRTTEKTVTTE